MLSRGIDVILSIHHYDGASGFGWDPWMAKDLSLPFSLETFRLKCLAGKIPFATSCPV